MRKGTGKTELANHYVYRTGVQLDKAAVIRGMNAMYVGEKFAGRDTEVVDLMIAGQHSELPIDENTPEGPDALRVVLLYVHKPSNQVGILQEDITYTFLRELAAIGMANR
jgi:hypothetical protein